MRCFVVGNGESLRHTNLDNLIGEVSFGCNNIHLIYPRTNWRPTHYVRAEEASGMETKDWIDSMLIAMKSDAEIWCNIWFVKWMAREGYRAREVKTIQSCAHHTMNYDSEYCPPVWHLPRLCTFGSTVNVAVQIAVQLGYSPIYLVGCDLGNMRHFDQNYEHGKERPKHIANLNTLLSHIIAKRSSPVPIYNATVGGELEVYERVDYESLFSR